MIHKIYQYEIFDDYNVCIKFKFLYYCFSMCTKFHLKSILKNTKYVTQGKTIEVERVY